jgi:hypothetical protein
MALDDGMIENAGEVFIDGTKVKANASRHRACSCKKAGEKVEKRTSEIEALLAEKGDDGEHNARNDKETAIRTGKLAFVSSALDEIEAQFSVSRGEREAAFEKAREERAGIAEGGGKLRGKAPSPPPDKPKPSAQANMTDGD